MRKPEVLNEILSDIEKTAIQMFVDNKVQREAVKKVLLFDIYYNGILDKDIPPDPLRNFALGLVSNYGAQLTDEQLGRDLRSSWVGINAVELAWNELEKFQRPDKKSKEPINPAR